MAQYLIQEETLTNIGDKIRVLNGTEKTMTPVAMASELDTFAANMETAMAELDSLITQINSKLST